MRALVILLVIAASLAVLAARSPAQTIEDCNRIADAQRRVVCYRAAPQPSAAEIARINRRKAGEATNWGMASGPSSIASPSPLPVRPASDPPPEEIAKGLLVVALVALFYFAPALIAKARGAAATPGVLILNLFLGWTVLGWIAALVWAVSAARRGETSESAVAELRALATGMAETAQRARANVQPARFSREQETNRLRNRLDDAPLTIRELTHEQEKVVRSKALRAYPCSIAGILRGERGIERSLALAALGPGAVLRFLPEPENPVDPLAVAILREGVHLGYVPRSKRWIADALAEGDTLAAVLSRIEEAEGYVVAAEMLVLVLKDG